jgi:hypothetical protein
MDADAFAELSTDVIAQLTSKQIAGLSTDLASVITEEQAIALQGASLLEYMESEVAALVYGAYPDIS